MPNAAGPSSAASRIDRRASRPSVAPRDTPYPATRWSNPPRSEDLARAELLTRVAEGATISGLVRSSPH